MSKINNRGFNLRLLCITIFALIGAIQLVMEEKDYLHQIGSWFFIFMCIITIAKLFKEIVKSKNNKKR